MPSSIKLTYFDARGRAETSRLILAYAGVDYEDDRLSREQFDELKPSLQYGQLPVMTVDGSTLYQSMTMARYLAREYGLNGASNQENAQADEIVDVINDMQQAIYLAFFVQDPAEKEEKMKEVLGTKVPQGLLRLEKVLAGRGGQFFAGNALTWAELHLLQFVDLAKTTSKDDQILDPTPKLSNLDKRIRAVPNIAKWLETRPCNEFFGALI